MVFARQRAAVEDQHDAVDARLDLGVRRDGRRHPPDDASTVQTEPSRRTRAAVSKPNVARELDRASPRSTRSGQRAGERSQRLGFGPAPAPPASGATDAIDQHADDAGDGGERDQGDHVLGVADGEVWIGGVKYQLASRKPATAVTVAGSTPPTERDDHRQRR